ncbi:substrate-binding domain-containing protein [Sedimentisphaera salicampi]|uniref:Purine nucleotide synthesis repressor n=1 Tax=Sedimentisphaera salicampi TaxID=1941349 RepID=A0A1W6LLL6_9BACT|nr:substrate-binding domain-containing protein [Sedimentisphaera salicampi]ARN56690.1 Purine nucleotide synthesis repressor [Sedimentisphaera salicampi]OXU15130.1 Purine nucleotide synthesis repressor [Sedimentisphaera salicampi]
MDQTLTQDGHQEELKSSRTLQDRVQKYLIEEVRRGNLREGDRVPTIKEVSNILNVSTKVAFLAVKDMRDKGWFEKVSDRKQVIARGVERLLLNQPVKLAFASCGNGHILRGVYQTIFNHLQEMLDDSNAEIECLLEMDPHSKEIPEKPFDAMIVSDWEPNQLRDYVSGPIIGLDTWEELELDYLVKTDHFHGGEMAARHLYESGRRSVVYWDLVEKRSRIYSGTDYRRLGFQKAWIDCGGHLSDIKVLPVLAGDEKVSSYADYAKEADAYFFTCDFWALQAWEEFKEIGIRVPEDVAFMGFDGSYEALKHDPPLSTMEQPCEDIAKKVLQIVNSTVLKGEEIPKEEVLVPPRLRIGGST